MKCDLRWRTEEMVSRGRRGTRTGLPSSAREPPGSLNGASEHDKLHTVNHRGAAYASDEGLDERFDSVHDDVSQLGEETDPKWRVLWGRIWWYELKRDGQERR